MLGCACEELLTHHYCARLPKDEGFAFRRGLSGGRPEASDLRLSTAKVAAGGEPCQRRGLVGSAASAEGLVEQVFWGLHFLRVWGPNPDQRPCADAAAIRL